MYAAMTDYSQGGEQAAIINVCEGITGTFLDIGAFCATSLSNTRALYELGWSGVMVEPSPGPLRGLIQEYGNQDRVSIIAAAVATEKHLVEFQATDDAVSTYQKDNYELWKGRGGFYGSFWVPTITLKDIMNQFGAFDFINIDTEGTSVEILKDLLGTEMFPRCICVEHDGKMVEIIQQASARGYKAVFASGENVVLSL